MTSPILLVSHVAVVSDNDGSAFITKAEFDSLKNNFQAQIDNYNQSIDSKIDGAIAAYLAGIKIEIGEDHLVVDWVRSFPDTSVGMLNCKYLDFYNNHQGYNSCKKGSLFPFYKQSTWSSGEIHLNGVCMWTGSDQSMTSGGSWCSWNTSFYREIYTVDHPVFLFDSWSTADGITSIAYQTSSLVCCTVNTLTGMSRWGQPFAGVYGYPAPENIVTSQFRDMKIIDSWWSDQVGFNVVVKYPGEATTGTPKAIPLLKAEDGQGDVNLMWNCYEPHPDVYTYNLGGKSDGYSLFDAANSKIFFAVTNPTTGVVSQIVTPEDTNIFCDTYSASTFKSATAHMRAGEMLFVYVGVKGISSTSQKYTTAARLKMSYQNLSP